MGGMDNRTGNGFAKDRRAGAHRARSFYKKEVVTRYVRCEGCGRIYVYWRKAEDGK